LEIRTLLTSYFSLSPADSILDLAPFHTESAQVPAIQIAKNDLRHESVAACGPKSHSLGGTASSENCETYENIPTVNPIPYLNTFPV
jgi:hypothetical protein